MVRRFAPLLIAFAFLLNGCGSGVGPGESPSATSAAAVASPSPTPTPVTLASIDVTASSGSVALGYTLQFTATAHYSDGSTADVSNTCAWSSTSTGVATVNAAGLATSVSVGTTNITATLNGVQGSSALNVTAAVLVSIAVTPSGLTLPQKFWQRYSATGTFSDGSTSDVTTDVTWSTSNGALATISNAAGTEGRVTTVAAGSPNVIATSGAISGNTGLTVSALYLASIDVTGTQVASISGETGFASVWGAFKFGILSLFGPGVAYAAVGINVQMGFHLDMTATGWLDDGSSQDITEMADWSSANVTVITVSNTSGTKGYATPQSVGDTQISASVDTVTGQGHVFVDP